MPTVITLHGVLQQPNGAPNPQGLALYRALSENGHLVVLGGLDKAKDDWFMATNGLGTHEGFFREHLTDGATPLARRIQQVRRMRAEGNVVDILIDPDPEVVAQVHSEGIPTLLYLHPKFTSPEFRPDYTGVATPWTELVKTVDYQDLLKASVHYTTDDDDEDEA